MANSCWFTHMKKPACVFFLVACMGLITFVEGVVRGFKGVTESI